MRRAADRLREEPCCLECVGGNSGWAAQARSGKVVCVSAFQTVSRMFVVEPLRQEAHPSAIRSSSATGMGQSPLLAAAIQKWRGGEPPPPFLWKKRGGGFSCPR